MTDTSPKVAIVVGMGKDNRVIGKGNDLPWRIPGDMKHFKRVTMGKPIIMGRKTYESIGRPLPGRTNIVITRDENWTADGIVVCHSVGDAVAHGWQVARADGVDEVCIIGGAEIYAQAFDQTDVLYLTEVEGEVEGDVVFPEFDRDEWMVRMRSDFADDPEATHKATLVEFVRREG